MLFPLVNRYRIWRATPTPAANFISLAYSTDLFYLDSSTLISGQNYCYKVDALNGDALVETSSTDCAIFSQVNIAAPDTYASPGDTFIVPINIRNATGLGIASADIWLDFDPSILACQTGTNTSMTVDFVWDANCDNVNGRVKISTIASPEKTIYGDGSLFWLTFKANGVEGDTSKLDLVEFIHAVGGSSLQTEDGQGYPVDVPMVLTDGTLYLQAQGKLGDVDDNGVVAAADALLALKISVGTIQPTSKQLFAADVNGDGVVNSADVSMILYDAVYGTWPIPATDPAHLETPTSQTPVVISLNNISGAAGSSVTTTLRASHLVDWAGGDWIITYDKTKIAQVTGITATGLAANLPIAYHNNGNGTIRISIASSTPKSGDGALAIISFKLSGNAVQGDTPLTLAGVRLSDQYGRDLVSSVLQGVIERHCGTLTVKNNPKIFLPFVEN